MSKRKYQQGKKITNVAVAIAFILAGANLYYRSSIKPAAFLRNWSLHYLIQEVRLGNIYEAERVAKC